MNCVRAIVFDLGGVLLNIDMKKPLEMLDKYGVDTSTIRLNPMKMFSLEVGRDSPSEFYERMREMLEVDLSDDKLEIVWNSIIVGFNKEVYSLIEDLRTYFKIYLLSNTNIIHQSCFEKLFIETFGTPMSNLFDEIFYSHQVHMRKPEPEIYKHVENEIRMVGSEILFVDDSPENVKIAKEDFRWHTLLAHQGKFQEQKEDLESLLNLTL